MNKDNYKRTTQRAIARSRLDFYRYKGAPSECFIRYTRILDPDNGLLSSIRYRQHFLNPLCQINRFRTMKASIIEQHRPVLNLMHLKLVHMLAKCLRLFLTCIIHVQMQFSYKPILNVHVELQILISILSDGTPCLTYCRR